MPSHFNLKLYKNVILLVPAGVIKVGLYKATHWWIVGMCSNDTLSGI